MFQVSATAVPTWGLAPLADSVALTAAIRAAPGLACAMCNATQYEQASHDDDGQGAVWRHTDQSNFYQFRWELQFQGMRLWKRSGGARSQLAYETVGYVGGLSCVAKACSTAGSA